MTSQCNSLLAGKRKTRKLISSSIRCAQKLGVQSDHSGSGDTAKQSIADTNDVMIEILNLVRDSSRVKLPVLPFPLHQPYERASYVIDPLDHGALKRPHIAKRLCHLQTRITLPHRTECRMITEN